MARRGRTIRAALWARVAAERERKTLEATGLSVSMQLRCDAEGADGTDLGGLVKAYVPLGDEPPSARPFGLVFAPGVGGDGRIYLELVAFGERHPRPGPEACMSARTSASTGVTQPDAEAAGATSE